jgi:hypothetical protein
MSRIVSRAPNAQNGGNAPTGLSRMGPKPSHSSEESARKSNIIDEAVLNDKSVQDVRVGAQTWGFAECDPPYTKDGLIPRIGDLRTEVEYGTRYLRLTFRAMLTCQV